MRRIFVFSLGMIVVGGAIWFWPQLGGKDQHPNIQHSAAIPVAPVSVPMDKPAVTRQFEADTDALDIDWHQCVDNQGGSACIGAITPLIASVPVIGDLSYVDLIERLDTNLTLVETSLADASCAPPSTGWSPTSEHYQRCGAAAFAEVGQLLQGCLGHGSATDAARRLEDSGITDVQALTAAEEQDSYTRLQQSWLDSKCSEVAGQLEAMPKLHVLEVPIELKKFVLQKRFYEYTERAVLLGDYRRAPFFAESAAAMIDYRRDRDGFGNPIVITTGGHLPVSEQGEEVALRHQHSLTKEVIDKIIASDPLLGYEQLADYQYHRFPDFDGHRPDVFDISAEEINNSYAGKKAGWNYYDIESDWEQRIFDMIKYQIVANRLAGRPEDLHFSRSGAGYLKNIREAIDMYMDANDLEYASQQAWNIVEEVRANPQPSGE